jgi:chromosome segregation ATPase
VRELTRNLHETLAELHRQLAEVPSLEPALREELRGAMEEIRARIEAGEAAEGSVLDRVSELTLRFEAEHPALADAAGAVARALARIGI